jgi:hypothetical protein
VPRLWVAAWPRPLTSEGGMRRRTNGSGVLAEAAGETTRVREVRWLTARSCLIFSSGEKVVPACESCVDRAGASRHMTK